MAKKSMIIKSERPPRFKTQAHSRCKLCGRPRAFIRRFTLCRICFRRLALAGEIPGVKRLSRKIIRFSERRLARYLDRTPG